MHCSSLGRVCREMEMKPKWSRNDLSDPGQPVNCSGYACEARTNSYNPFRRKKVAVEPKLSTAGLRIAQQVHSCLDSTLRPWLFLHRTVEARGLGRQGEICTTVSSSSLKGTGENWGLPRYLLLSMSALEKAGLEKTKASVNYTWGSQCTHIGTATAKVSENCWFYKRYQAVRENWTCL